MLVYTIFRLFVQWVCTRTRTDLLSDDPLVLKALLLIVSYEYVRRWNHTVYDYVRVRSCIVVLACFRFPCEASKHATAPAPVQQFDIHMYVRSLGVVQSNRLHTYTYHRVHTSGSICIVMSKQRSEGGRRVECRPVRSRSWLSKNDLSQPPPFNNTPPELFILRYHVPQQQQ